MTSKKEAFSPVPWVLGIVGALIISAIIQVAQWWVDADAYDSEVVAAVAPVSEAVINNAQQVLSVKDELKQARLENRLYNTENRIYQLESAKVDGAWNARDAERLAELQATKDKAEAALEELARTIAERERDADRRLAPDKE